MIGNVEMKTQSRMQRLGMIKGEILAEFTCLFFHISNDPPRALFIWRNDGYSVVRRAT
jgi:hypothetical protein